MTQTIWLATTNKDKVKELKELLSNLRFNVKTPSELGAYTAPNETGQTFKENALIKARFLHSVRPEDWVLADDSGLEVDGLGGLPGVYSARYAGPRAAPIENNSKLLKALSMKPPGTPRTARFKCVICLMPPASQVARAASVAGSLDTAGNSTQTSPPAAGSPSIGGSGEIYFEGLCEGTIAKAEKGRAGFGYDPLFIPQGYEQTIGELGLAVKNRISHRAQALRGLVAFFKEFRAAGSADGARAET